MCSDAPDYSGMNKAAEANAEISKEALDFYRQAYEDQKPLVQASAARAQEVSDAQLASMRQNDKLARDYADYQAGTFRPMERAIVQEAETYDTNARRDQAAGEAMADATQQAAVARDMQQRGMTRMGVNPNDGKFLAMGNQMAMQEALGKASAATTVRRMDAANLGRGLASNQPDCSVDVVMFNFSLCHASDWEFTLREARRVLKEGGSLFIFDMVRRTGDNVLMSQLLQASAYPGWMIAEVAQRAGFTLALGEVHRPARERLREVMGASYDMVVGQVMPATFRFVRRTLAADGITLIIRGQRDDEYATPPLRSSAYSAGFEVLYPFRPGAHRTSTPTSHDTACRWRLSTPVGCGGRRSAWAAPPGGTRGAPPT